MVNKKKRATSHLPKLPGRSNINFISFQSHNSSCSTDMYERIWIVCCKDKPMISVRVTTLLYKSYRGIGYITFHYTFAADQYRMGRVRSAIQKFVIK